MNEKTGRAVRIEASIDEIELETEEGGMVAAVQATCSRCGHETTSYGTSDKSITRCLVLLREECPKGENNFYYTDDDA